MKYLIIALIAINAIILVAIVDVLSYKVENTKLLEATRTYNEDLLKFRKEMLDSIVKYKAVVIIIK